VSSVNVIRQRDAVYIVTDGAACLPDGKLSHLTSKVVPLAHLEAAIAVRGLEAHVAMLGHAVAGLAGSYDELKACIAPKLKELVEAQRSDLVTRFGEHGASFDLFVAGISETTGPDSYVVASHDLHPGIAAWSVFDPGYLCLTPQNEELLHAADARLSCRTWGQTWIAQIAGDIVREQRHIPCLGGYMIGGFAQLTTVKAGSIETRIIRRWPDRIGEAIAPRTS
jgi:hypothetical protein